MQATDGHAASTDAPTWELVRAAFRDVHGSRLHGFALLLTLGAQPVAARIAAQSLADGAERAGELRHPERAAAWLRARTLHYARRERRAAGGGPRDRALSELGADDPVGIALGVLRLRERAVLIASDIERLDLRDVSTIVGIDGAELDRTLQRARTRYADAFAANAGDEAMQEGLLSTRIRTAADRALR